jgi:hypothetical protein
MESSGGTGPEITYENVEPLLVRSRVNGTTMEYVFRCPSTSKEVTGTAPIPQYDVSVSGQEYAKRMAGATVHTEAEFAASDAASRIIPGAGVLVSAADNLFRWRRGQRKSEEVATQAAATAQELPRQMLVQAFGSVADQFTWDPAGSRWIAK